MQTEAIRDALAATAGVQSVESVSIYVLANGERLVTARLGFGPSTANADVVSLLDVARASVRALEPSTTAILLEPVVAAPRGDANLPTDVFVIRGED